MNIYQLFIKIYEGVTANNKYLEAIYNTLHADIPISEPNASVGAEPKDEPIDEGKK